MNDEHLKSAPFGRSPDRRIRGLDPQADLRQRMTDRRREGPGWISLFRDIDESLISRTISDYEVLSLPAGTLLLKPGQRNDCVYLILSGALAAHFEQSLNPAAAMPIMPGECVGEFSAIDGKPVSAFVLATQESRILHVRPEAFWNQLMPIPGVARNLMISLTERMRRSNEVALDTHRKQLTLQYLKQELEVARQLQAGMLPLRRPMFAHRLDIEIAGSMEPASEIGGDLFDAFFIEENLLFLAIGDVSGHGIPAALFMARIVGLMRISAMGTNRPDQLLERINDQLCEGNDTNMFVTLFCGFLEIDSGRLMYSNAGHCAPILISQGLATQLPIPKGALVGVLPGARYTNQEIVLNEDDAILCFTDGVTEAQTQAGEEFSEARLLETISQNTGQALEELLRTVRQNVADFTHHRPLDDDCTMLAVRRPRHHPPQPEPPR